MDAGRKCKIPVSHREDGWLLRAMAEESWPFLLGPQAGSTIMGRCQAVPAAQRAASQEGTLISGTGILRSGQLLPWLSLGVLSPQVCWVSIGQTVDAGTPGPHRMWCNSHNTVPLLMCICVVSVSAYAYASVYISVSGDPNIYIIPRNYSITI